MKTLKHYLLQAGLCGLLLATHALATNPLITDQFTADPTARVFADKVYIYPSHDIRAQPGQGRPNWFCMEDYHVFSSENLTDWVDHGVILNQTNVPWANPTAYSMWAPDCVAKNGKYYFFFPTTAKAGGFNIGVAVADHPAGPFLPEAQPIAGVRGIDPCVFIDHDGSAYLYYSMGKIFVAKLKPNLLELDGAPMAIENLPAKGLLEGPFVFARNGVYYLTYPHVQTRIERLEYATSTNPLGPFKPAGVILDESPAGCWTVHHSIVEYQGQWYLFYHDQDLSPNFDKNRSIRADYLTFAADGTIQKVVPTLRGVGLVNAKSNIQIDRYSAISDAAVKVSFLETTNPFAGWKISLPDQPAWLRFDRVDFGREPLKSISIRAAAATGGSLEIRLDQAAGPLLAKIDVKQNSAWQITRTPLQTVPTSVHNLFVVQPGNNSVDLDWIRFE